MSAVAVAVGAGAVATIYAGQQASSAAKKGAAAQAGAAKDANAVQLEMFNQQRSDQQAWKTTGEQALGSLRNEVLGDDSRSFTMADFQKDPGYDFRMAEGQKALERSAAARGNQFSGGQMKAVANYGQSAASAEYQNAYNRFNSDQSQRFNQLSSLAGLGQTANGQIAAAGQNYANNTSNNMMGAANAQAAGYMGSANAQSQMVGNLTNLGTTWMGYQMGKK